jgi:hypothetical protein
MMNGERPQMISRPVMLNVLTAAILMWAPSAAAQRTCDPPVPGLRNRSEVSLFVSGFWSSSEKFTQSSVSHQNYHEMTNHTFPAIFAGLRVEEARVADDGAAERRLHVQFVSHRYFDVLGISAAMGRTFDGNDDRPEDKPAVAVISDQLWLSMFYLDPRVVGRRMKVNGRRVTIVGVAPSGFHGVLQTAEETLWLPGASMPGANTRGSEGYTHFVVTLGDDIRWDDARRYFGTLPSLLAKAFPDVNQKFKAVGFYDLGLLACPSR